MRNLLMIVIVGLGGIAVLMSLGFWQLDRLAWKEAFLSEIAARIDDAPAPLPVDPDAARDRFQPVEIAGTVGPGVIRVLASRKNIGAGHRIVVPFETDAGRRVMVDLGFLDQGEALADPTGAATITGNLHWPDETDGFTPAPDLGTGLWFARDVAGMADTLGTEALLVVRRTGGAFDGITAWPVDTVGIPNDHREYAITWFSLAAIWVAMTGFLVYRMRKPKKD